MFKVLVWSFSYVFFLVFSLNANAQNGQASFEDSLLSFLPIIVLFGIFYFLIIRPQSKRMKTHKNMITSLAVGDNVVVAGGIMGEVAAINSPFITVLIASDLKIQVQKDSVASILPKGTIKFG